MAKEAWPRKTRLWHAPAPVRPLLAGVEGVNVRVCAGALANATFRLPALLFQLSPRAAEEVARGYRRGAVPVRCALLPAQLLRYVGGPGPAKQGAKCHGQSAIQCIRDSLARRGDPVLSLSPCRAVRSSSLYPPSSPARMPALRSRSSPSASAAGAPASPHPLSMASVAATHPAAAMRPAR